MGHAIKQGEKCADCQKEQATKFWFEKGNKAEVHLCETCWQLRYEREVRAEQRAKQ